MMLCGAFKYIYVLCFAVDLLRSFELLDFKNNMLFYTFSVASLMATESMSSTTWKEWKRKDEKPKSCRTSCRKLLLCRPKREIFLHHCFKLCKSGFQTFGRGLHCVSAPGWFLVHGFKQVLFHSVCIQHCLFSGFLKKIRDGIARTPKVFSE